MEASPLAAAGPGRPVPRALPTRPQGTRPRDAGAGLTRPSPARIVGSMNDDLKARAAARLGAALDGADQGDPRPYYRRVLRYLKDRDAGAFDRATRYFENELVPACAGEADPLEAWLAYGRRLCSELGAGRTMELDSTGRARPVDDPASARGLVLYLPDAETAPVLVLRGPRAPSDAQKAAVELLVHGRQTASAYE